MGMGGQNIVGSQQAIRQQNPQVAGQIRQRQLADQQRYSQSPQPYAPVGNQPNQPQQGLGQAMGGKGGGQSQIPPQMLGQLKDMLQKNQPQNPMVQHQQQQPNQMQLYQDMLRGQQNSAAGSSPYSAQAQQAMQRQPFAGVEDPQFHALRNEVINSPEYQRIQKQLQPSRATGLASLLGGAFQ